MVAKSPRRISEMLANDRDCVSADQVSLEWMQSFSKPGCDRPKRMKLRLQTLAAALAILGERKSDNEADPAVEQCVDSLWLTGSGDEAI
jgi:hypothetical protein